MTEAQRAADVACRALAHEQLKREFEASLPHVADSATASLQCVHDLVLILAPGQRCRARAQSPSGASRIAQSFKACSCIA